MGDNYPIMLNMTAKILQVDPSDDIINTVKHAADCLNAGGLVIFPTETVYGVAARVGTDAVGRIYEIKNRPADKPFAVHMGSPKDVHKYVNLEADSPVQRLINKALPGPLTCVVYVDDETIAEKLKALNLDEAAGKQIYNHNLVGLRCPADEVALELLSLVEGPVVATSANMSGAPDSTSASAAVEQLGDKVHMVLDTGETLEGQPSTVVKVHESEVEVLREGVYSQEDIEALMRKTVLFICTGNTCRSPMAAAIARHEIAQKHGIEVNELEKHGYCVLSAGVYASPGSPMTPEAGEALKENNIPCYEHESSPVTHEALQQADAIYCMTESHMGMLLDAAPEYAAKIQTLIPNSDISDPIGHSLEIYRKCADQIQTHIRARFEESNW